MKNAFLTAIVCTFILFINSCEKCYKCHNICKTCTEQHTDTTLTVQVCSDVFGEKYFNEYLDSLQNTLGYTCADAPSTINEDFCGSRTSNKLENISRRESGYVCVAK